MMILVALGFGGMIGFCICALLSTEQYHKGFEDGQSAMFELWTRIGKHDENR